MENNLTITAPSSNKKISRKKNNEIELEKQEGLFHPAWLNNHHIINDDSSVYKNIFNEVYGIDDILINNLSIMGINKLLPVQHHIVPIVLSDVAFGVGPCNFPPNDLCINAPTGSGKTLAFALPIVQSLLNRVLPATRALVVLPTRELAIQVHTLFKLLCANTTLQCVLLCGGLRSLKEEQNMLTNCDADEPKHHCTADIIVATPGRLLDHIRICKSLNFDHLRFLVIDEADRMASLPASDWLECIEKLAGQNQNRLCKLNARDVMKPFLPLQKLLFSATLANNGRNLNGLNLFRPHLYVVKADDTDSSKAKQLKNAESIVTMHPESAVLRPHRYSEYNKNDSQLNGYRYCTTMNNPEDAIASESKSTSLKRSCDSQLVQNTLETQSQSKSLLKPSYLEGCKLKEDPVLNSSKKRKLDSTDNGDTKIDKNAAVTPNSGDKDDTLEQDNDFTKTDKSVPNAKKPKQGTKSNVQKYITPKLLKENWIVVSDRNKPLALLDIIRSTEKVLCFARSNETVHRLSMLLTLFARKFGLKEKFTCSKYSSKIASARRFAIVKRFREGAINVLVCSDSLARGVDIPDISCVISYDAPHTIDAYIHRIGRTARAGKPGVAYTLVTPSEAIGFKTMLKKAGKKIKKKSVTSSVFKDFQSVYEEVLPHLEAAVKSNKDS